MQKISNILLLIRLAKGFSQYQLAKTVGIDKSLISRYESGNRRITQEKFKQICKSVQISPNLIRLLMAESVSLKNKDLAQEIGLVLLKVVNESYTNINKKN